VSTGRELQQYYVEGYEWEKQDLTQVICLGEPMSALLSLSLSRMLVVAASLQLLSACSWGKMVERIRDKMNHPCLDRMTQRQRDWRLYVDATE